MSLTYIGVSKLKNREKNLTITSRCTWMFIGDEADTIFIWQKEELPYLFIKIRRERTLEFPRRTSNKQTTLPFKETWVLHLHASEFIDIHMNEDSHQQKMEIWERRLQMNTVSEIDIIPYGFHILIFHINLFWTVFLFPTYHSMFRRVSLF